MALKKLNVVGSVVGTLKDVEEALDFTARGLVHVSLYIPLVQGIVVSVRSNADSFHYIANPNEG